MHAARTVIKALRARRGRDYYPVGAMWRALVAGVFQHGSIESLLRELGRNAGLLSMCGLDPLPRQGKPCRAVRAHPGTGVATVVEFPSPARSPVPRAWNFSRFLESLERVEADTDCVTGMLAPYPSSTIALCATALLTDFSAGKELRLGVSSVSGQWPFRRSSLA